MKGPGASKTEIRKISVFQWTDLWYSHYSNFKALPHHDLLQFCLNTFRAKRLHCQLEAAASFEIQWWCHRTTQRPEDEWRSRCGRAKVGKFQGFWRNSTANCFKMKIYQIKTYYQNCIYSRKMGSTMKYLGQLWPSHQNGLAKYLAILLLSIAADIRTTFGIVGWSSWWLNINHKVVMQPKTTFLCLLNQPFFNLPKQRCYLHATENPPKSSQNPCLYVLIFHQHAGDHQTQKEVNVLISCRRRARSQWWNSVVETAGWWLWMMNREAMDIFWS